MMAVAPGAVWAWRWHLRAQRGGSEEALNKSCCDAHILMLPWGDSGGRRAGLGLGPLPKPLPRATKQACSAALLPRPHWRRAAETTPHSGLVSSLSLRAAGGVWCPRGNPGFSHHKPGSLPTEAGPLRKDWSCPTLSPRSPCTQPVGLIPGRLDTAREGCFLGQSHTPTPAGV